MRPSPSRVPILGNAAQPRGRSRGDPRPLELHRETADTCDRIVCHLMFERLIAVSRSGFLLHRMTQEMPPVDRFATLAKPGRHPIPIDPRPAQFAIPTPPRNLVAPLGVEPSTNG